jgi:hypothetical protein
MTGQQIAKHNTIYNVACRIGEQSPKIANQMSWDLRSKTILPVSKNVTTDRSGWRFKSSRPAALLF